MPADSTDLFRELLIRPSYGAEKGNAEDIRLWQFLSRPVSGSGGVALLGFPFDEGVRRNGGRIGAAAAPSTIREFLGRLTPDPRGPGMMQLLRRSVFDFGDVHGGESLEQSQQHLGEVVSALLAYGSVPIILGGGHETSFGHFLGYTDRDSRPAILNIDAHPDVRLPVGGLGHSGSPFRQAIESSLGVRNYTVAGLSPSSVAATHVAYLEANACQYFWDEEVSASLIANTLADVGRRVMVTIDMDVVDQAASPGVSAPSSRGIDAKVLQAIAFECGVSPAVTSLDIVEVNPRYDIDDRTSRLAAVIVWQFLRGLSSRASR